MNSTESIPTAIPLPTTWRENAKKKALGLLGLDRVLGAANIQRAHLITERLAQKTQDGTLGKATTEPQDKALETMEIRVGDEVHHHYPEPSSPPAASAPVEPTAAQEGKRPRPSWLLPAALVVGSALTGGAVPTGLLIYQAITAASESPPPAAVDHDTTRRIDIERWVPPK